MIESLTLPFINTCLNASALVFMISGYVAVRRYRALWWHKMFMYLAVLSSAGFLTGYLIYHFAYEAKKYQGDFTAFYYTLLLSHIVLAVFVPFLVGTVMVLAWRGQLERHKRLARKAIWIWGYVSLTGILVYCMVHG